MLMAVAVLALSLMFGIIAHELSHSIALRVFGIDHDVQWLSDRSGRGVFRAGIRGRWAHVDLRDLTNDVAPWKLRVAALMPLLLIVPLLTIPAGLIVDPFQTGNLVLVLGIVGWMACAIPSPADFAIFWHPHDALH